MRDNALSHLFHFYVNLARKSYQNSKMFSRGSGPRERERDRSGGHPYVGALRFVAKFRSCFTHTHTHRPKIVGDPEWQFSFKSKNFNELWKTLKFSKGKKNQFIKTTTRNRTAMTNT